MLPSWLKQNKPSLGKSMAINNIIKSHGLHTVCQSAKCPNIFECFAKGTATFMILGDACTRHCRFCSVKKQAPLPLASNEAKEVADACCKMKLKHVVITSVTRDDLPDGGAGVFYDTIMEVRKTSPGVAIEVLTPDFQGNQTSIRQVVSAQPDIFNHNIETVPRLYSEIRPEADYQRSLKLLAYVKELNPAMRTKSGLMLGLGEREDEVLSVLKDLRVVDCDMVTIGQYLRPSLSAGTVEVARFVPPEEFEAYRAKASEMGFKAVASGPFVRSSYMAAELYGVR
ncbi:MAG: lipoyl synthase [Planctomycetes bacterium]|nr:lipoyl synthase [Planctomycetota bacterium]